MQNRQIAQALTQFADLLEFQGANAFRVRAYRQAAHVLDELSEQVVDRLQDSARPLADLPGIGKDLAQKIEELAQTGQLAPLEALKQEIPLSVLELVRIPGLGPKKAAVLFHELGIRNLADLRVACDAGKVAVLKGFGEKSAAAIRQGLELAAQSQERMRWDQAETLAEVLRQELSSVPGVERLELAGSFRRGRETVGDLDILVVATTPDRVMDRLAESPEVADVILRGDTKMSIRSTTGTQVDLRVVPAESFGAAWQYFTGSQDHNVTLRSRAKALGLKVNEYGVFRLAADGSEIAIAGATEEAVYQAVGLPWIPPELRENREEFAWADQGQLPQLIQESDLRGDLHMHTVATDGSGTLEEMAQAAQRRGWEYMAITDHSQRVSMARGLDPARLLAQWHEIDRFNQTAGGRFVVLKGIECDILEKGGMDLPDDVLAQADWVVASIHYGQQQSREQITERMLGAVEHASVDCIAHPTGRLLGQRPPYEIDLDRIFRAVAEHGKCLELNANPRRLDLHDLHCMAAKRWGIPIVINSDAHSPEGMAVMRYGILQARRAGLQASDVLNTLPWPKLKPRLQAIRSR